MSEAKIAAKEPAGVELDAERGYAWCTCGRSAKQPFCDGAHKETGFTPMRFKPEQSGEAWLCQCKQTKNGPYCDGTHNTL